MSTTTAHHDQGLAGLQLLDDLLSEEVFVPSEPATIEETGLNPVLIESIVFKYLMQVGSASGRAIAQELCISHAAIEDLLDSLRSRQLLIHSGQAQLGDYYFALTDQGAQRAERANLTSAYVGPLPVPLDDYLLSVDAQSIRAESPQLEQLQRAFREISISEELFALLGPAINSGAGLFLYGEPGNGKTTIAQRITRCFGQSIWIPHAIIVDGQIIKLYDATCHERVKRDGDGLLSQARYDRRWINIKRPTVVVGGELTLDGLEISYDPATHVCEAPLQLKSNCGVFLIDDFGRQRVDAAELLNRWIVPLENGHDFLTLPSGKKLCVPFEQLIIFSTNLDPVELGDEAFLRRIPYKIEVEDPNEEEFHLLFQMFCREFGCPYRKEIVDWLLESQYEAQERPLRRCHPRDFLFQLRNLCAYQNVPLEMRREYFTQICKSYFTMAAVGPESNRNDELPKRATP